MKSALALLLLSLSSTSMAQIYTCPDGRGGKTYQQTPCAGSGSDQPYVRCIRANGSSYLRQGTTCPTRTEQVPHQPGMVTDVRTGQQTFMVPGGGNGMIDPRTGQRHELISPPPTRTYNDQAQPVSAAQACAEEKARYDRAMSDFNRTMTSMRAAEARYERMCGKR